MADWTRLVKEQLEKAGCHFFRQGAGDHETWFSPHSERKFPVDGKIRSRHTANEIMEQAGIPHRFR